MTLVPYEPKLIDYSLLNERQVCVKKIISLFQILVIVDIEDIKLFYISTMTHEKGNFPKLQ